MKTIKHKTIRSQIVKEYKQLCNWCNMDNRNYGMMMIDVEDGTIWADCCNQNEWVHYKSNTIQPLEIEYNDYLTYWQKVSTYTVAAAKMLERNGWIIETRNK